MATYDMVLIPEREMQDRTTLATEKGSDGPVFADGGPDSFRCAKCKHVLAKDIKRSQLVNVVLKCPKCDANNDMPPLKAEQQPQGSVLHYPHDPKKFSSS